MDHFSILTENSNGSCTATFSLHLATFFLLLSLSLSEKASEKHVLLCTDITFFFSQRGLALLAQVQLSLRLCSFQQVSEQRAFTSDRVLSWMEEKVWHVLWCLSFSLSYHCTSAATVVNLFCCVRWFWVPGTCTKGWQNGFRDSAAPA